MVFNSPSFVVFKEESTKTFGFETIDPQMFKSRKTPETPYYIECEERSEDNRRSFETVRNRTSNVVRSETEVEV